MGNLPIYLGSRRDIKIAIFGLDNAGKSTLAQNLAGEPIDEDPLPTVGFSSKQMRLGRYQILLMDLGGGRNIRGIWSRYFAESHGIIFVVDASAAGRERIGEARQILRDTVLDERTRCKPLLVLCNKYDDSDHVTPIAMIQELDLQQTLLEAKGNDHIPAVRVYSSIALKSKSGHHQDSSIRESIRWLLCDISKEWGALSVRVSEQYGKQLEEEERERQERIERRRQRREEQQRIEEQEVAQTGQLLHKSEDIMEEDLHGNPFKPIQQVVRTLEERGATISPIPPPRPAFTLPKEEAVPAITSTLSLQASADVLSSIVSESRLSNDILTSPHPPVQSIASATDISSFSNTATDECVRRDSGVCLQDGSMPTVVLTAMRSREDRVESELESAGTESIASSVSTDQGQPSRRKKKRERQSRMLSRLRNKNKVLPSVSSGLCSSALASKPPLKAPWLTNDTELPCEIVPNSLPPRASEHNHTDTRIMRLPPLAISNQAISNEFHLSEDISLLPLVETLN